MFKIGTDIIEIERIAKNLSKSAFMDKVYTKSEQEYIKNKGVSAKNTAAGLFCAKEAIIKAIGTGFIGDIKLTDIHISHDAHGAPIVNINHNHSYKISLSISHCKEYATATAIYIEG